MDTANSQPPAAPGPPRARGPAAAPTLSANTPKAALTQELAPHWPLLSSLLDEALDLPPGARPAWLHALAGRSGIGADIQALLRTLLADDAAAAAHDFLRSLPPLAEFGAAGSNAGPNGGSEGGEGPVAGDRVGPWQLLKPLGEGGMGQVFLADRCDGGPRRQVALKLPRLSWQAGLAQRLQRERDALSRLAHPCIARLYDAGVDNLGRPWLALEYIDGLPIDQYCQHHALPLRDRVVLVLQVASAVAFAHAQLVTHRDLKPSNVLVSNDGRAHLLDFGIAGLLAQGQPSASTLTAAAGRPLTLRYAAPEQVAGLSTGTAGDVFSLGVLAIELLAGASPYSLRRGTRRELEDAILSAEELPQASSLAPQPALARALCGDLDAVLAQAVRKQPAQRYATMAAFVDDLGRWLAGLPVRARRIGPAEQAWRWARRHAWASAAAGSMVAVLLVATLFSVHQAQKASQEAARARHEAVRAQAVQGLLLDMFRVNSVHQPDPLKAQQTTVRELVDLAARRAGQVLKDAPESQVQVLGALGDLYVELGLPKPALDLLRERWQIAQRTLPVDDVDRADAALALAARLYDGDRREEARQLLAEAGQVLERAGPAADRLRGRWHLQHAMFQRYENLGLALAHVHSALQAFEQHDPQSRRRSAAFYIAGTLQAIAGQADETLVTLEQGRRVADAQYPAVPFARFSVISDLAEHRRRAGQWRQAEADSIEALALAETALGPLHRSTLVVLANRADHLLDTGRTGEALILHGEIRRRIAMREPAFDIWWVDHVEYLMRRSLVRHGRPDLLLPNLSKTVATLESDLPRSGALATRMRLLCETLLTRGELAAAGSWCQRGRALWRQYAGDLATPAVDNRFVRVEALLLLAQGQPAAALQTLQALTPEPPRGPGDVSAASTDSLRAEALRQLGRRDEALASANAALAVSRGLPEGWRLPGVEADAWLVKGLAHQALGHTEAAQAAWRQALALREAQDLSPSLHAGRLRAILQGLDCGLAGGLAPDCFSPSPTRHDMP